MYSVCSVFNSLIISTSVEGNGNPTCSSQHPDLPPVGNHFANSNKTRAREVASKFICSDVSTCA